MADKILCVLAGYDETTQARLSAIQNELYTRGFVGTHTKNLPMHITLGTFKPEDEKQLVEVMTRASRAQRSFDVTFNHVGVFGGSKVLFVAPDTSAALLELKENFGCAFNWTPHTTMLIDEPARIYAALPIAADSFTAFRGQICSLHLYEFWPTRHILSLRLTD